ncbi:hypothetical protein ACKWTF_016185 [Chironomus riparius]
MAIVLSNLRMEFFIDRFGLQMQLWRIFFVIGGILTAKALGKGFEESNKLKWIIKYYIKRVMRLLPATALILVLIITSNAEFLAPYSFSSEKENCKQFWWMTLTFNL